MRTVQIDTVNLVAFLLLGICLMAFMIVIGLLAKRIGGKTRYYIYAMLATAAINGLYLGVLNAFVTQSVQEAYNIAFFATVGFSAANMGKAKKGGLLTR